MVGRGGGARAAGAELQIGQRGFDVVPLPDGLLAACAVATELLFEPGPNTLFVGRVLARRQKLAQRRREIGRALIASGGIARQAPHHDGVEHRRNFGPQRTGWFDSLRSDGVDVADVGAAAEQALPGHALPQHDPEAEDVGPPVERGALDLLGRAICVIAAKHARKRGRADCRRLTTAPFRSLSRRTWPGHTIKKIVNI